MAQNTMAAWNMLPNSVAQWALRNIQIEWTTDMPTAAAGLTRSGYKVFINPEYWDKLPFDEDRRCLLIHEISHILRGDCLVGLNEKDSDEKHNPMVANLAMDAIINQNQVMHRSSDENGWLRLGNSKDRLGFDLTMETFSWQFTYNEIMKKATENGGGGGGQGQTDDAPFAEDGLSKGDAQKEHAKTVLDARDAVKGTELEGAVRGHFCYNAGNNAGGRQKIDLPPALGVSIPDLIANKVRSIGQKVKVRSFRREGVVSGLKGVSRQPKAKVLVALDVSGSCTGYWPLVGGAAARMRKMFDVELCTFSDHCAKFVPGMEIDNWNGGTLFQPVLEYAERVKADILVVVTDGELYDFQGDTGDYSGKVAWFLTPGASRHNLESVGPAFDLPAVAD